jgi:uncharacterized membrane protein YhaH (DUF805 family)
MLLVDAWKTVVMERYAKFEGRAARGEFWWFVLTNLIVVIVLAVLAGIASIFWILYVIYALGVIIPSLAVGVRRLHDGGRSGWWYLIALVPFVGGIILLVMFVLEGTPGPNQYGEAAAA